MQAAAHASRSNPLPRLTDMPINALLLDDSKFDRQRLRRMSRDSGLPLYLDEVSTIEGLSEQMDEAQFDVILLDYRLTVGDGIEALEAVRNHPRHAQVPTIMVTGMAEPEVAIRAMRLGCSDFLLKSQITAESLRKAVVAAIEKSALAVQSEGDRSRQIQGLSQAIRKTLQPELASLMRAARTIRTSRDLRDFNLPGELELLELRCGGLWSVLSGLDNNKPVH
jgi:CheY-like chemotaxis protein